jgi:hypothetical protein
MDLKIGSNHQGGVNAFYELVKGESKYYSGNRFMFGQAVQGDPSAKEYTVGTLVKSRTPDQYTRYPSFVPLMREHYLPGKGSATRKETTKPKDKPDDGDEDDG